MTSAPRPSEDFETWESDLIRNEVRSYCLEHRFRWSDREDLFQECLLHWWEVRDRYRSERGASRRTFMKRVVQNVLHDLFRAEQTEARCGGRAAVSLDRPVGDDEGEDAELVDFIGDDVNGPDVLGEVAATLDAVKAKLTARQQRVLDGLLAGYPKAQLAADVGIHRDTLYEETKRIREVFREEGLA